MQKENKWGRLSPMLRDATRQKMQKGFMISDPLEVEPEYVMVRCAGTFPTEKEYRELAAKLEERSKDIKMSVDGARCLLTEVELEGVNSLISYFLTKEPVKKKKAAKKKVSKKKAKKKKKTKKV